MSHTPYGLTQKQLDKISDEARDGYQIARDHPGVDHTWLNGFACIRPSDEFAAEVGRAVISKVMQAPDRKVALTFNAS